MSESAQPQWHWHYRVGLALTGLLLLFTLILLPLTVASAVRDVLGLPLGEQFVLSPFPHDAATPTHTDLHPHATMTAKGKECPDGSGREPGCPR